MSKAVLHPPLTTSRCLSQSWVLFVFAYVFLIPSFKFRERNIDRCCSLTTEPQKLAFLRWSYRLCFGASMVENVHWGPHMQHRGCVEKNLFILVSNRSKANSRSFWIDCMVVQCSTIHTKKKTAGWNSQIQDTSILELSFPAEFVTTLLRAWQSWWTLLEVLPTNLLHKI